jgi:thioredoxin 1
MAVIHLNGNNFDEEILKSEQPALVDFWADWCMPCKMLGPVVEALGDELDGKVIVGKVNIDESSDLAAQYGVMSIPTLVLFKNGQEVDRMVGNRPKDEVEKFALQ